MFCKPRGDSVLEGSVWFEVVWWMLVEGGIQCVAAVAEALFWPSSNSCEGMDRKRTFDTRKEVAVVVGALQRVANRDSVLAMSAHLDSLSHGCARRHGVLAKGRSYVCVCVWVCVCVRVCVYGTSEKVYFSYRGLRFADGYGGRVM